MSLAVDNLGQVDWVRLIEIPYRAGQAVWEAGSDWFEGRAQAFGKVAGGEVQSKVARVVVPSAIVLGAVLIATSLKKR